MALTIKLRAGYVFSNANDALTVAKLNAMFSQGYAEITEGQIETDDIGNSQVTAVKLATTLDLSGKTLTLPTSFGPQVGINPASTIPQVIGQIGLASGNVMYIAYGTSAGNWRAVDDSLALLIATQWYADGTNFPAKTTLAPDDLVLIEDSADSYKKKKVTYSVVQSNLPAKYKSGLYVDSNATSANTQVDVGAHEIVLTNSAGLKLLVSNVSDTCDLSSPGVSGLDTGTLAANTLYYIFLIATAAGTVHSLASTSQTPILPTNYTYYRLVGEVCTNVGTATLIPSDRDGDVVMFLNPQPIYTIATLTTSYATFNLPKCVPNSSTDVDGADELYLVAGSSSASVDVAQVVASVYASGAEAFAMAVNGTSVTGHNQGPTTGYGTVHFRMHHQEQSYIRAKANHTSSMTSQNLHVQGYLLTR